MRIPNITSALRAYVGLGLAINLFGSLAIYVQPGDSLAKIAAAQGISIPALESANTGVVANDLQPGQILNIPNPSRSPPKSSSTSTLSTPPHTPAPPPPPPPIISATPVMSVGTASCAPPPIGKHHDVYEVWGKTEDFCDGNGHHDLSQILAAPFDGMLSGDSQETNGDDGNGGLSSNERGYDMTISAVPYE